MVIGFASLAGCASAPSAPYKDGEEIGFARTSPGGPMEKLTPERSAEYARLTAPYALFANHVYCKYLLKTGTAQGGECEKEMPLATGWARLFDSQQYLTEPEKETGLAFTVFVHAASASQPKEILFAFRGTDFTSLPDWRANAHWLMRRLPSEDQYEVLHRRAPKMIDKALEAARTLTGDTEFKLYATGHSLGGGLAQHLAFSDTRFKGVVVFDPTPVTGYKTLITDAQVNCNVPVLRVYETGEILSYVRSFIRRFYSLSDNIHELSFNVVHGWGNPIKNHSMEKLSGKLQTLGSKPGALAPLSSSVDRDCMKRKEAVAAIGS